MQKKQTDTLDEPQYASSNFQFWVVPHGTECEWKVVTNDPSPDGDYCVVRNGQSRDFSSTRGEDFTRILLALARHDWKDAIRWIRLLEKAEQL